MVSKPTWLVLGAGGLLGSDMVQVIADKGHAVVGATRAELDITDAADLQRAVSGAHTVINCAAYTAVDDAESNEEAAFDLNARAAGLVARTCANAGARLVHISTDYVFRGDAKTPYEETAARDPRTAYGRSKSAGEDMVLAASPDALIVRTAWLYGRHGSCFPKTIVRIAAAKGEVSVVDDQWGQPTWTRDVSAFVSELVVGKAPPGIYHGTASGATTWFEFAQAVLSSSGIAPSVRAVKSDAFPRPAPRPHWSVLGHDGSVLAKVEPIGHWLDRWHEAAPEVLAQ